MSLYNLSRGFHCGEDDFSQTEVIDCPYESKLTKVGSDLVPANATTEYTLAVDVSELEVLYISASRDVTIKTNSSGAPDDVLTIKAGSPLQWSTNCGFVCPLGTDVTVIFVIVAAGAGVELRVRAGHSSIPSA
jgi:hypothetical protein